MKFLLSYIFILLLPTLIVYAFLSSSSLENIRLKLQQDDDQLTTMFSAQMERELDNCKSIADNLCYRQPVAPFRLADSPTKAVELIKTLNRYTATSSFFSDIAVYFYEDQFIYSASASATLSRYGQQYQLRDPQQFREVLTTLTSPVFFVDSEVFYCRPYIYNDNVVGAIVFVLPSANLERLMRAATPQGCYTALFSAQKTFLTPVQDDARALLEPHMERVMDKNFQPVSLDGCMLEGGRIGTHPVYFMRLVFEHDAFQSLESTRRLYFIFLGATLLGGLALAVSIVNKLYQPIRVLKNTIPSSEREGRDEFKQILHSYTQLDSTNRSMAARLRKMQKTQQTSLLKSLLYGNISSPEEFWQQCQDVELTLNAPWHTVLLATGQQPDALVPARLCRLLQCPAGTLAYIYFAGVENGREIYIAGSAAALCASPPKAAGIAVGQSKADLFALHDSYAEACVPSGSALAESADLNSLDRCLARLESALRADSPEQTRAAAADLAQKVERLDASLDVKKIICFKASQLFCQYGPGGADRFGSLNALLNASTQAKFLEVLSGQLTAYLGGEAQRALIHSGLTLEAVEQYVRANCRSCEFSLQSIAEHFRVSEPYISRFFKNAAGQKLIDYYTDLRMQCASELLTDTELPLREIAVRVGYFNLSSFIRRFKQYYGVTPGEYKNQNKK